MDGNWKRIAYTKINHTQQYTYKTAPTNAAYSVEQQGSAQKSPLVFLLMNAATYEPLYPLKRWADILSLLGCI